MPENPEHDEAPHLSESQDVAPGNAVHDQTPGSDEDEGERTPIAEQCVSYQNNSPTGTLVPRVQFGNNNKSVTRTRRSMSLDSLTQTSSKEALQAIREARHTVNAVHEDVIERQKQLDAKIEAMMQNSEPPGSSVYPEETPEPSTFRRRDKGIDPRNWGSANIPEPEMDPEIQRALLKEAKEQQDYRGKGNRKEPNLKKQSLAAAELSEAPNRRILLARRANSHSHSESGDEDDIDFEARARELMKECRRMMALAKTRKSKQSVQATTRLSSMEPMSYGVERMIEKATGDRNRKGVEVRKRNSRRPAMDFMKPSNQIPRNSFLGRKFLSKKNHHHESNDENEEYDNQTDNSWSNDEGEPPSEEFLEDQEHWERPKRPRYKDIAPTKPDKYNGEANILKFHRYVSQCERYLSEGEVPIRDRVAKCSDFLEGKAYKYYSTEVSFNEERWSTERFFKGIFNYCFPPDFRMKQRDKLERFHQKG